MSVQEEQHMVQDADTRNLVMVPIVHASFSWALPDPDHKVELLYIFNPFQPQPAI